MTRPVARIVANGVDITTRLFDENSRPLVSLTITDEAGVESDSVEIVVDNREARAVPPIGSIIEIWLGYEPEPTFMGKYRLDQWEKSGPPHVLKLSGASAELTTSIKETKSKSWHDTTVGAIVEAIASKHGLGASTDATIAARAIEHIDQSGESDMGFLTRLAKRHGATFKVANGKVLFADRASESLPSGETKGEVTLKPEDVESWSVTSSERGGHQSVIAYWHDHKEGKRKKVTAGSGSPAHRDKRLYRTEAEAKAAATAKLGEFTRSKREGQVEAWGNPAIFAEGVVNLDGFDPDCDGKFFARSVTHTLAGGGYRTSVSLETTKSDPADD